MTKALVLHSGGLDSTAVLSMALRECDEVQTVSFDYGSRHAEAEQYAAELIASYYHIPHRVIELPKIFSGGGRSALMGEIEMPHISYREIAETPGESPTVVPYRNGVMLSMAAAIAEVDKVEWIYAAMHGEDARNWAYPDCTPEFLGSMANAIYVGTYGRVRFKFPFAFMMKSQVCKVAVDNGAPVELTWSCYAPVKNPNYEWGSTDPRWLHCGECPTCIERIEAFKANGWMDPIDYAHEPDWMGCNPPYDSTGHVQ